MEGFLVYIYNCRCCKNVFEVACPLDRVTPKDLENHLPSRRDDPLYTMTHHCNKATVGIGDLAGVVVRFDTRS